MNRDRILRAITAIERFLQHHRDSLSNPEMDEIVLILGVLKWAAEDGPGARAFSELLAEIVAWPTAPVRVK